MGSFVAVLRSVFLALFSGIGRVLGAAARHARAAGRVTTEAARAIGAKVVPAASAGAVKTAGRVKSWIFKLPHNTLHFIQSKLVEILVTLVITAGIAYFLSDSEAIREERIACWMSDYTNEWFGAKEPLAEGTSFRVLVAQLEGDEDGHLTRNVVESLAKIDGIEVRELCRSLGVPPGKAISQGVKEAEETAHKWLADWNAGAVLWGKSATDENLRLRITTAEGSAEPQLYELSKQTGFLLPAAFDSDFVAQLQAWLVAGLSVDPKDKFHVKYSKLLVDRLPALRGLATLKGLSPEARVSAVTIYFVAYQRVMVENLRVKEEIPEVDELKEVTAGLSKEIDPDKDAGAWATAVALEATALMMTGEPDELKAAGDMLLALANDKRADPDIAASAAAAAAMAWSALADLTQSPEDMYRARDLVLQARANGAARSRTLGPTVDSEFARTVLWLGRNLNDYSHAEEALEAASRAAAATPIDEDTGGGINVRLTHADLLAGLATANGDLAGLKRANAEFDAVLTQAVKRQWRLFYVNGLEQSFAARLSLAEATGKDEDFARALAVVEEAQNNPVSSKPGRALGLAAYKATISIERATAASNAAVLKSAIAELRAALEGDVAAGALTGWSSAKTALADAVIALARLEGRRPDNEGLSIQREVVARAAKEKDLLLWAQTSEKLADMMLDLAIGRRDPALAREGAALMREVMARETTREKAPVFWAANQARLGRLLQQAGEARHDAAALAEAEKAYRAAAEERPRERVPALWFEAMAGAGLAETRRAEFLRDEAVAADAVATLDQARGIDIPAGHPDAQLAVRALAQARVVLARLRKDPALAVQARDDLKALLATVDRAHAPSDWAWASLHYANALVAVGSLTNDAAVVDEGRALLEEVRKTAGARLGTIIEDRVAESISAVPTVRAGP